MILIMYLNMISAELGGKKELLIFGQTLLILTKVCSKLQCSWWELDWGIRTLKKSAKFKLFKDFQLYSRFSSLLISRSYQIPTVKSVIFTRDIFAVYYFCVYYDFFRQTLSRSSRLKKYFEYRYLLYYSKYFLSLDHLCLFHGTSVQAYDSTTKVVVKMTFM